MQEFSYDAESQNPAIMIPFKDNAIDHSVAQRRNLDGSQERKGEVSTHVIGSLIGEAPRSLGLGLLGYGLRLSKADEFMDFWWRFGNTGVT